MHVSGLDDHLFGGPQVAQGTIHGVGLFDADLDWQVVHYPPMLHWNCPFQVHQVIL